MKFTRESIGEMRPALQEALAAFERAYGVTVDLGNISYSETEFHLKLSVVSNVMNTPEGRKEAFAKVCGRYGLTPEHFGCTFVGRQGADGPEVFELIGIETGRSKYPILGRSILTGKELLFTTVVIARMQTK